MSSPVHTHVDCLIQICVEAQTPVIPGEHRLRCMGGVLMSTATMTGLLAHSSETSEGASLQQSVHFTLLVPMPLCLGGIGALAWEGFQDPIPFSC